MSKSHPSMGSPRRIPLTFCALGLTLFLSACASNPAKRRVSSAATMEESRSELVFLNIAEASGWVAYNCNPSGDEAETETYRVVVIRQKSGEVIYDSQIPLATDLCTHGFEMSPEDPRLKKLGRNVDSEIIEPLEAYQKSLKDKAPATETAPESKVEPEPEPAAQNRETETASAPATVSATAGAEAAEDANYLTITGTDGDSILIECNDQQNVKAGDRVFLLTQPEIIAIPGTDEKVLISKGEVTGLAEIQSVEKGVARAKILNGEIPESGVAEIIQKP
ncbi:hypothetical protein P0Y35_10980 [Kiritimatiellaeota bacterium B1221]|nr:hypothetical protein [Kiritimatiellaeota bacterium B1221]